MERKEYSKPYLVAETFTPQEFCAPCKTKFSGFNTNCQYGFYIDSYLQGRTEYFDKGYEYTSSNGTTQLPPGVYKDVKVYYLRKGGSLTSSEFPESHDYTTSDFTYNGSTYHFYKLTETYDIKVIHYPASGKNQAYYNVS